jgi:thiamine-monophosphate kinase
LGIGDDCAILRPPVGSELLVTTDMTLERRHFRRDLHPAESVGHRCLARGLSDLAAMGARPMAAFLSLALPPQMLAERKGRTWTARFLEGMRALAERTGVPLAGGDTAQAEGGLVMADIVLLGSAPAGQSLRRSGAGVGDRVYVTGALGGAAGELEGMLRKPEATAHARTLRCWTERSVQTKHPQMFPQPRLRVGAELLRRGLATACMDISDGLSTDLVHLVRASGPGLAAEVMLDRLPIHPEAVASEQGGGRRLALHGGEDYELLFTAGEGVRVPRMLGGVEVTEIGRIVPRVGGEALVVGIEADGTRAEVSPGGWEHFSVTGARTNGSGSP